MAHYPLKEKVIRSKLHQLTSYNAPIEPTELIIKVCEDLKAKDEDIFLITEIVNKLYKRYKAKALLKKETLKYISKKPLSETWGFQHYEEQMLKDLQKQVIENRFKAAAQTVSSHINSYNHQGSASGSTDPFKK